MTVKRVRGGGQGKDEGGVPAARPAFARVVESVFRVPVSVEEYERLERELALRDEDATRPEAIRAALNRVQRNASAAHRLYIAAKVEYELFETACERYLEPMRQEAIRQLAPAKSVTDKAVTAKVAALYPDQAREEQKRREEAARTVAHLYRLADLWKERAFALGQMK